MKRNGIIKLEFVKQFLSLCAKYYKNKKIEEFRNNVGLITHELD